MPKWFGDLETRDKLLAELLYEIYAALQNDPLVVATAGTRILLDRVMLLLLGEDAGGFADKLRSMTDKGIIGAEDRALLGAMIDAGHAASHRGYRSPREHLETIIDTIENLLQRKFVLPFAATEIKLATPIRAQRR